MLLKDDAEVLSRWFDGAGKSYCTDLLGKSVRAKHKILSFTINEMKETLIRLTKNGRKSFTEAWEAAEDVGLNRKA